MPKNDYWKLSAYESAKLIKDGSILAEDLVSSCIERVNQTNNKINAIVDDLSESALEKAHELDKLTKNKVAKLKTKTEVSVFIGKMIADNAKTKKISKIVFDRNGFPYHGRVKALAESARKNGLKF